MLKKNTENIFCPQFRKIILCQFLGRGGGVVAKRVFRFFFFSGLKSLFIVRFINVKKWWFYLFAQHSSSKKSTCPMKTNFFYLQIYFEKLFFKFSSREVNLRNWILYKFSQNRQILSFLLFFPNNLSRSMQITTSTKTFVEMFQSFLQ